MSAFSAGGSGGDGPFDAYAYLREQQAAGTDAGTFTSGAWRTRVLNTEAFDTDGIVSLASNQFTLQAGTYLIVARAPATSVNWHKLKLRNITDSSDALIGGQGHNGTENASTHATLVGRLTIAAQKTFELQHQCFTTKTTNGLGVATNFGLVEVYAEVEIWREGTGSGGGGGGVGDILALYVFAR